jgi:DNA-binding NarL/FixJ family response regulator
MTTVAIVDDYVLIRRALVQLIENFDGKYQVLYEYSNGVEFLENLILKLPPDIVVLDVMLPAMAGLELADILKREYPSIKVVGISVFHNMHVVDRMRSLGAMGFVTKDVDPVQFHRALDAVACGETYFPPHNAGPGQITLGCKEKDPVSAPPLNTKELEFLRLCATEMTYKEIASKMRVKTRTVDNYRDSLFEKLNVISRSGLIMFAFKVGLAEIK